MRKCKRISRAFNGITAAADNDNKNNIFRNDTLFSFSISFNKSKWWGSCINDSFCEFHASNKIIWIMPTNVPTSFGHTWAISVVYTCKLLEALYLNRHPICSESLKLTQITVFTFVFFPLSLPVSTKKNSIKMLLFGLQKMASFMFVSKIMPINDDRLLEILWINNKQHHHCIFLINKVNGQLGSSCVRI